VSEATGQSLLAKLRAFTGTLDDDERRLFAALIGPGVEQAVGNAEVELFSSGAQEYDRLVQGLVDLERGDHPGAEGVADSE
jgi:hypothetical protein